MLPAEFRIGAEARLERCALAQEPPQYGVHITLGSGVAEQCGGTNRLIYHRVGSMASAVEGIDRTPQQGLQRRVGRSAALRKGARNALHASIAAQRSMREIHEGRSRRVGVRIVVFRQHLRKTAAPDDLRDRLGGIGE